MPADRRVAGRLLTTAVAVVALAGCASGEVTPAPTPTHLALETFAPGEPTTNGVEHLAGADVLTEAIAAIDDQPGMQFTFQHRDAATGSETTVLFTGRVGAVGAQVTTADGTLDLVFGTGSGEASGTGPLAERYDLTAQPTCRSGDDAVFHDWAIALDPGMLLRSLTADVTPRRGGLSDADPPTLDVILDSEAGTLGTLVVAASGAPLPVRLVMADESGTAVLDVTGWDAADLAVPAEC